MPEEKRRTGITRKASLGVRNNNLDEGITTFGLWLNAEDKKSPTIPIVMKEFTEGIRAALQDNMLQKKGNCKNCRRSSILQ
jgi:hypothetical protein